MSTSKLSNELTKTNKEWTLAEYRGVLDSYYTTGTKYRVRELDRIKAAYKVKAHEYTVKAHENTVKAHEYQLKLQLDTNDRDARTTLNNVSTEFKNALQILETTLESGADPVSAHRSMHDAMDKWNKADEKAAELFKERCPLVINSYCSSENGYHCWFDETCIRRARADGTPLLEDELFDNATIERRDGCLTEYTDVQEQRVKAHNMPICPCDHKEYCIVRMRANGDFVDEDDAFNSKKLTLRKTCLTVYTATQVHELHQYRSKKIQQKYKKVQK